MKYVIIDAEAIQKRIEELKKEEEKVLEFSIAEGLMVVSSIKTLQEVLLQSTPLIPEIEKAFDAGVFEDYLNTVAKEDYITNLKL